MSHLAVVMKLLISASKLKLGTLNSWYLINL